jgi:N-acetylmuramoyl-L-alanine amidase
MEDVFRARRRVLGFFVLAALTARGGAAVAARLPGRKPPIPRRLPIVVIDPGHGGIDPGAIGPGGVYEKDITFPVAQSLARELTASGRFRAVLIRREDEFVPLRERVSRARAAHGDLFLSIHADALPNTALRGLSVFTLSAKASDREAADLAASENREIVDGVNLSRKSQLVGDVLLDLARRQTDNLSIALARDVVTVLGRAVPLLENPQRSADFAVLTAPDIPSALVELGCLSNPAEERLLQQRAYQQRLARALALAIEQYFAGHPPAR